MIEYIIIAILQGLFEWLPISSSGQVMIVSVNLFGIPPEEAFSLSIWVHLGTALAVLIKLRKDYIQASSNSIALDNILRAFFFSSSPSAHSVTFQNLYS